MKFKDSLVYGLVVLILMLAAQYTFLIGCDKGTGAAMGVIGINDNHCTERILMSNVFYLMRIGHPNSTLFVLMYYGLSVALIDIIFRVIRLFKK